MTRVYFIRPIGMDGPIKIGCSFSPDYRRSSLETWSPFPLEIIAEIEGDFRLESRFHAKFIGSYRSREWFDTTPELVATIEAIRRGDFDPDTLPEPQRLPQNRKPRTWSKVERKRQSYSLRISNTMKRSGFYYPGSRTDYAAIDLYLAEPHVHGKPCVQTLREATAA